ncbi:hypothetical protein ASC93_10890 [Massilia sp. Root335]|nr:hypothetical protein ASC93_10890 [Massilia sp. Root335]
MVAVVVADDVRSGAIAEIHKLSLTIKMAAMFVDGLMPWPEHFFSKTCGRLYQLIFLSTTDRQKADGHV